VNNLFNELHAAFERAAAPPAPGGAPASAGAAASGAPLKVTKTRPRPEGMEFIVEGLPAPLRFLNSMSGVIWVYQEEGGRFRQERLITIHFEEGRARERTPRAIEKPAGVPRAPFRFTSVPQLIAELRSA